LIAIIGITVIDDDALDGSDMPRHGGSG
jgi:hypothetical protein